MDKEVDDMPQGWPTQPRLLGRPTLFTIISNAVVDILSIAASITFLAFASVVLHYDSTETSTVPHICRALTRASIYVGIPST
jgi:hypothetical protein